MSIINEIEDLQQRASTTIQQSRRRDKLELYCEGLKNKVRQVEFALLCLAEYSEQSDSFTSSTSQPFLIFEKVNFYCDSFWAFLYSSLDVLGQIINQSFNLQLDEQQVSIKKIMSKINRVQSGTPIQQILKACIDSRSFKNLDRYRNCSLHRRHIYIEVNPVSHSPGYPRASSTTLPSIPQYYLCDDPLSIRPRTAQQREIPTYMERIKSKIDDYIIRILRRITPQ